MADKNYKLKFTLTDGKTQEVEFTAPQGPKGDQGIQGIQGPAGAKGPKGDTGAPGSSGVYVLNNGESMSNVPSTANVVVDPSSEGVFDVYTQIAQLQEEKANKSGLTLGVHTDGLVYIFIDGTPHGNGLDIKADVVEGDVFGYVDENNVIVLNGALAEGTYTIKYEMDNGDTVEIGDLVLDTNVYYTITNTLTQCTTNNSATKAVQGGSYSATITAKSGYELSSIKVTMGGSDISASAVSGGKITISNVTGNIVITAVATEKAKEPTNFAEYNSTNTSDWNIWINNARAGSDGAYRSDTYNEGYGTPAVSNYIAVQNGDIVEFTGIYTKGKNTVVYGSTKNVLKTATLTSQTTHLSGIALSSDEWDGQFTVNNSNVAFIRLGGYVKPESRDIVIKIKRNGEYL